MEQNKALYETLFIVRNTIGEEEVKSVIEKFTALITDNGEIDSVNEWGTRHLAYPIDDLTDGYYVLIRFRSAPAFPAELERLFNINNSILRSLTIRVEE